MTKHDRDYLLETLKLSPEVAARLAENDRWGDKLKGEPCLMPHNWCGDGAERRCTDCGLTAAESLSGPWTGHLPCLGRPVR